MSQNSPIPDSPTKQALEISIRLGIIFLILFICLQILWPFVTVLAWAAIIAVALYKPFLKLVDMVGGRKKLAVVLITLIGLAIILVPAVSLSLSMADSAVELGHDIAAGTVHVPPPTESVKDWPVIGEKTYTFWHDASTNLRDLLAKYPDQLKSVSKLLLSSAAGVGVGILQFVISILIAAAFLSNADILINSMKKLAQRLAGNDGLDMLDMSAGTIKSVAVGVLGIAMVQAILGGLGMLAVGVPAAGLIALVLLIFAIAQVPLLIVMLPVCFYVFSVESSTTVAVIFLIWSVVVSVGDAALKPMFLGRGVDAPMLVILLGAIGGMITSGIIGLFVGAVVLAVGYKLFRAWVVMDEIEPNDINTEPVE